MILQVLIVSNNPVKIKAVKDVFSFYFKKVDFLNMGIEDIESLGRYMKSQPIGEDETYNASRLRVKYAQKHKPQYDYFIGIEGGIALTNSEDYRIIVYCSIGTKTSITTIRGCEIPLSSCWYTQLLRNPKLELGDLVTEISGIENIKQKEGAAGFLTYSFLTRYDILKQCITSALIPFLNPRLYELSQIQKVN